MLDKILNATSPIQVLNVGASILPSSETPVYVTLLRAGLGALSAFDGDSRQIQKIVSNYGSQAKVYPYFLYDGTDQKLHVMSAESGLTSILEPDATAFAFFNGFTEWGTILSIQPVKTARLDDITDLPNIDFAKMDVQGAELTVMKHGTKKLEQCVAVQLEVSFVQLYKKQPSFGEVDLWMRSQGYAPHRFIHIKRWSISPVVFDTDVRKPGNQLLEADIVYVRDPFKFNLLGSEQLQKLALISHYSFGSPDLCTKVLLELVRRGELPERALKEYAQLVNSVATAVQRAV